MLCLPLSSRPLVALPFTLACSVLLLTAPLGFCSRYDCGGPGALQERPDSVSCVQDCAGRRKRVKLCNPSRREFRRTHGGSR